VDARLAGSSVAPLWSGSRRIFPAIFKPILAGATLRDRLASCIGAVVGISLTMFVCARLLPASDLPAIVAPLGASPLAQPWPVIGGNVISFLVGVTAFQWIPNPVVAAGMAVGGAILVMSLLRCLHPPGGAAALTAVIGGPAIHAAGYTFAFAPVGLNSIALVLLAASFHRLTHRSYPHRATIAPAAIEREREEAGFHPADIDAALADMHESFDIARDDLDLLLSRAEQHAQTRRNS
jgi:CBS domain-containing membrane protein